MSKSSELDQTAKRYILKHIDKSGYSEVELTTNADRIAFLLETFEAEYGWAVKQHGQHRAIEEWLMALPTAVTLPIYNHDIIELAVKWGSLPEDYTRKQADAIIDNYWNFTANKIGQLFRGYRVPADIN